jgi:hypothetical protein
MTEQISLWGVEYMIALWSARHESFSCSLAPDDKLYNVGSWPTICPVQEPEAIGSSAALSAVTPAYSGRTYPLQPTKARVECSVAGCLPINRQIDIDC